MARTPKENRNEVASAIVNLRVTEPEREALEALMREQQTKLAGLGVVAPVSQATVIRSLIQKEARAVFGSFPIGQTELPLPAPKAPAQTQALVEEAKPVMVAPEPPAPEMVREKIPELPKESSSSPIVPDKKKLQARFAKAIERKKTSTAAIAAEIGVSTALLQKFKQGNRSISDGNAMALAAALDRIGG